MARTPVKRGKGRPTKIDDPAFAEVVAEAYINGLDRETMADAFGVCKDTITNWTGDPRVKAHAARLADERIARLTRKVDSEIEARLGNSERLKAMDDDTLIKLRKELLGNNVKVNLGGGLDVSTAKEAWGNLEDDPELASKLSAFLDGRE